jgi:hypothetical protein
MSDERPTRGERPLSQHGARSTQEGPVPGLAAVEVDREIQFRQLLWMGLGLVAVTFASGVVVFFLLRGFLQSERAAAGPPPLIAAPPAVVSGPQLLARPEHELARVRQLEAEQIDSYGWIDAQQGLVRIPIDRAIDLVAAQGLPSRQTPPVGAGDSAALTAGTDGEPAGEPVEAPPAGPAGATPGAPQASPEEALSPVGPAAAPAQPSPAPPGGQR